MEIQTKKCGKCGASWVNGQLYWATGAKGSEADLAGLGCDKYGDEQCINALKGTKHDGDTWEARDKYAKALDSEVNIDKKEDLSLILI